MKLSILDEEKNELGFFRATKLEGNFDKTEADKKEGESESPDYFLTLVVNYDKNGDKMFYEDGKSLMKILLNDSSLEDNIDKKNK